MKYWPLVLQRREAPNMIEICARNYNALVISLGGLVVGCIGTIGLVYLKGMTGGQLHHQWCIEEPLFVSTNTCLAIALMKSLPHLCIQTGKCIMRIDSFIWGGWRRNGTKTWRTSSTHLGSMLLTRAWWGIKISPPPGFMCFGRKPHHFVNERHTIFCGLTSILWREQIVGEEDRPSQLGPKLHL